MSNKKLPSVKRSITLREDVFEYAMEEADKYFAGNLSAYLTFLVSSDLYGTTRTVQTPSKKQEVEPKVKVKEESQEGFTVEKSKEQEDLIDSFMNFDIDNN